MHFGQPNNFSRYTMLDYIDNYVQVNPVIEENDRGVTFESNLKLEESSESPSINPYFLCLFGKNICLLLYINRLYVHCWNIQLQCGHHI